MAAGGAPSFTLSIIASSRSLKKMRFGRPHSGSCSARWRSRVSPAAMVAAVLRMCRSTRPASSTKPPSAMLMKGVTLLRISAPGWFGFQAKRAIDSALLIGQIEDIVAGRSRPFGDIVQIVQPQLRGDLSQHVVVDEFHAQDDGGTGIHVGRSLIAVGDRDGGDDRGAAEKRLQAGGAMIAQAGHVDGDGRRRDRRRRA